MKVNKSTIIRTVLLVIVIINLILKAFGKQIIEIDEGTVESTVEAVISIVVIIISWWKNNSFSENAIKADEFMKSLTELKKEGE